MGALSPPRSRAYWIYKIFFLLPSLLRFSYCETDFSTICIYTSTVEGGWHTETSWQRPHSLGQKLTQQPRTSRRSMYVIGMNGTKRIRRRSRGGGEFVCRPESEGRCNRTWPMDRVQPWNTSLRDIIISFFKCQTTKKKKRKEKSFPFFFLSCQDETEDRGQTSATPSSQDFPFFFRKKERKKRHFWNFLLGLRNSIFFTNNSSV